MGEFLRKVWLISYFALIIGMLAMPACDNYNKDINHKPLVVTETHTNRFSYKDDLFVPLGESALLVICAPITAPVVVYGDVLLLTNKIQMD